jgi:hypothetical protein
MPRTEARLYVSIWDDEDFLALPSSAQRLYMFLISQKDLTFCGVIPLRITRWARKAKGLTITDVRGDLELLTAGSQPFIIMDDDTGELLVRTFVRNDRIWRQPNLMKSARAAAQLIESATIRAALIKDLERLRPEVAKLTSRLARDAFGELIAELWKGCGNPSALGQRNPSGNPTPEGGPNASADPSQGKGEGYGPVLEVSPFPGSPSPRAGARDWPAIPHVVPAARTAEEGEETGELDTATLVAEIRAIRGDWSTRSITRALADSAVAERPWPLIRAAALALARDPDSQHPGRLAHDGPWWRAAGVLQPAVSSRPDWCGTPGCSRETRRLADPETGADAGPCPRCHPSKAIAS